MGPRSIVVFICFVLPSTATVLFEPTQGQSYVARVGAARAWFSDSDILLEGVRISFPKARMEALEPLSSRSHYFHGKQWRVGAPNFGRLRYASIYPGIDLVFYGNPSRLECDFIVRPGADPRAIRLRLSGEVKRDAGDLLAGGVRFHKPVARQAGRVIPSEFRMDGGAVTFLVGRYDRRRPLVIDPEITFATYLGGGGPEMLQSVATDGDGNIYVAGQTSSPDFPVLNAEQPVSTAYAQAFVTKFDKNGALVFSTYVGGSDNDAALAVAIDANRNIYVTGNAHSKDFPLVNPIQGALAAQGPQVGDPTPIDAFVFKLSADGSRLLYSTYLGGNDHDFGQAIAVDADGNAYVGGRTESTDFPVTAQAIQPLPGSSPRSPNGFVAKLNAAGNALVYSTYLSGSQGSNVFAVAVDRTGNVVAAGSTSSRDFPAVNTLTPTIQPPAQPVYNYSLAFVSKLTPDGSALIYSTLLNDAGAAQALGVAVDAAGDAYVAGGTATPHFVMRDDAPQYLTGNIFLKSVDGGASWRPYRNGLLVSSVNSIAPDPSTPGVLFAGTSEGVFKSLDGGQNWSLSGLGGYGFSQVIVDPRIPSKVYALTGESIFYPGALSNGVFRSTDSGASWQPFGPSLKSVPSSVLFDPMDLRTIYAVGGGLFKSTDDGTTWTNLNPAPQVTTAVQAAAMDPSNPLVLYEAIPSQFCGFFCGVIPGAVLKSTDGGQTWAMKQVISQATVLVDPNSPATIYADNFRSADGGETWTQLPQRMRIVAIDSNSNLYGFPLSGPITQLEISADGGQTWAVFYDATASSPLATFAADPASPGTLYLGGAAQMDAFLVKLGPEGGLIDTKFLGGSGADHASAVAVDGSGNAYLAGSTDSGDFPAVGPVLPYAGPLTTFATRLDGGTYLPTFSSFLGAGAFFVQTGMAVDAEGNIIVVGSTMSPRLPVTNAIQPSLDGASDAFVIKVKPD